jgi:integrase
MIAAEIDKLLTFHVARHTFLTHVAKNTGSIFQVMKYGGLRKTDTAMIYVHLAGV